MIDFEIIETFLSEPQNYISNFYHILNIYKERFKVEIEREDIEKWEDKKFFIKIRRFYEFLKLNFYEMEDIFYNKTNLEFIEFPFVPFIGLGVANEWTDIYKNSICSFLALENVHSIKSLIALVYKSYAMGYILNRNDGLLNLNFYNNLRNLIVYGFGNFVAESCTNYNVLISVFQSQRSIYKIFQSDMEKNLKYYLFRFLDEVEDSSLAQFSEWFLISKRGQYIGYKLFQFYSNDLRNFLDLDIEIYKFKLLEFYNSII